jgi:hypothetical protein
MKTIKKDQNPEIFLFFLKPNEEKYYGDLKKFVLLEFDCPSQIVRRRTLNEKTKGVLSCASKIVMQMNVKMGHPLWIVPNKSPHWKNNKVAVAGIASSKGKMGTSIAFVGTTDLELTKYFCDEKRANQKSDVSTAIFSSIFTQWIKKWYDSNEKKLPNTIIVYREGLNEVQAQSLIEIEIQGLLNSIDRVREKSNSPNFNPAIVYMIVNKKPNSRIFERLKGGKNTEYQNP